MEKKNIFAKFSLKWALGAMLIAGALMTGCKDDTKELEKKIDELEEIINELRTNPNTVTSVTPITGGYKITFANGTSVDVVSDGLGVQDKGDYFLLNYPGGSVILPKVLTAVSSVTLIPEHLSTDAAVIPFRSVVMVGNTDGGDEEYDLSGTTTLRYRISPDHVKKSAFRVKGFESVIAKTLADAKMNVIVQSSEFDEETGILTVLASYNKDGVSAADGALGTEQDRLQLVIENIATNGDVVTVSSSVGSEFVPVVRKVALMLDSAQVYDKTANSGWANSSQLSGAPQGALLFAWDTVGGPSKLATYLDDATGMEDYATAGEGKGSNAAAFNISTRKMNTVAKEYISSYDFGKQVNVFSYNGVDKWDIKLEDDGFTPVYHFDTLRTGTAAVDDFLSINKQTGMITFPAFNTTNMAYTPAVKVWATIADGRDDEYNETIAWGAVKLQLKDSAPTYKYSADLGSYAIKSWDHDTIWLGDLADMATKAGISLDVFKANYELGAVVGDTAKFVDVTSFAATTSIDTMVLKGNKFGIIIDKDAKVKKDGKDVIQPYTIKMTFVDQAGDSRTASTPDVYGAIAVELKLKLTYPDLSGMTWTKTASMWLGNQVVVDGRQVGTQWAMMAPMRGVWTAESYKYPAGLTALGADSTWTWKALAADGKTALVDTVSFSKDTINLAKVFANATANRFINKSYVIKATASVPLLNHGGKTFDGTTVSGAGTEAVNVFEPIDVVFGMPVAPLALSGKALELKGASGVRDSLYVLNGVKLTNYLFGQQAGEQQIIIPADDVKKQVALDTALVSVYGITSDYAVVASSLDNFNVAFSVAASESIKDYVSIDAAGLLKWSGGINVTADETVNVTVTIKNKWNPGNVGNKATQDAVKVVVPVKIKTVLAQ